MAMSDQLLKNFDSEINVVSCVGSVQIQIEI